MRNRNALPALDLLVGFEAAARHLSFTKAGEELFLTQSAVSRQIKELEWRLNVQREDVEWVDPNLTGVLVQPILDGGVIG